MKGRNEWSAACAAGVVAAVLTALHMERGDGEVRVVLVARVAIVLLAFAVLAALLAAVPRKQLGITGGAALANAGALAYALEFVGSSSGPSDLKAWSAIGVPAAIAAIAQVVAFGAAAYASYKSNDREPASK